MRFIDVLGIVFYNLWRRKFRTFLTTLAVVIGATLVALIISLGDGLQTFIERQFGNAFAPDVVNVYSTGTISSLTGGIPSEITSENDTLDTAFTAADYQNLKNIPGVERIEYLMDLYAHSIQPQGSDKKYTVLVIKAADYEARLRTLITGTYYDADASGVCLLTYDYVESFGWKSPQDALGKEVTITMGTNNPYTNETRDFTFNVIGVLEKTSSLAEVLIPSQDAREMGRFSYGEPGIFTEEKPGYALQLKVSDTSLLDTVARNAQDLGFDTLTSQDVLASINTSFSVIRIALSVFGGISLVVAVIGIINTLMMAIHERTREIGIMKAIGATKGTIRILFTLEGGFLGLAGGVIGVILSILFGELLNLIGASTFLADFPGFKLSVFSPPLILGVIALTTVISLLAGLYPANRAAGLDPVDSLRYE
jgi:putative ABC transport system permease protein